MIGVGFGRVPPDAELDAVEALFTERGAPLQAEISTLADPEVHATLARRGYQLRGSRTCSVQREGFQLLYARQLLVKETSASPRP